VFEVLFVASLSAVVCCHRRSPGTIAFESPLSRELASDSLSARRRFNGSLLEKRRYADQLSRSLLLAEEARRRHLDRAPVIERRIREVLVDELLRRVRREITPASITDADLTAYRAAHPELFEEPARTRVGQVVLPTAAAAESLRAELAALPVPERLTALRAAAARASLDAPTRDRGGDLGFLDATSTHVPAAVLAAALKLDSLGELTLVPDRGRFVLLVKTDSRPAQTRPEAEAREEARRRLVTEKQDRAVEELVRRLESNHPQRISDEELARITAPDRAPSPEDE